MVSDIAAIGASEVAEFFDIPVVVNSPTPLLNMDTFLSPSLGTGASAHFPGWHSGHPKHMSFLQRCLSVIYPRVIDVALTHDFAQLNQLRTQFALKRHASQQQVLEGKNVMVNTVMGFEYPQFSAARVHYVGALLGAEASSSKTQSLGISESNSEWAKEQVSSGKPLVFVSFGSASYASTILTESMFITLNDYTVVWLLSSDDCNNDDASPISRLVDARPMLAFVAAKWKDLPNDIFRAYWEFCQDDPVHEFCSGEDVPLEGNAENVLPTKMLVHELSTSTPLHLLLPKFASHVGASNFLFITHCGLVSVQEAIIGGGTILCIPLFDDQHDVAARVVESGTGLSIDASVMTRRKLKSAIEYLFNSYELKIKPNIDNMAMLLRGPAIGLEHSGNVIESVAQSFAYTVDYDPPYNWVQAKMLDVYTLIVALGTFGTALIVFSFAWITGRGSLFFSSEK